MKQYLTELDVAMACHEANRALCRAQSDLSQPSWTDAPAWQRDSALMGVRMHLDNPESTPADSHESWLAQKISDGWVYGRDKDADAKTHPCIVPYSELSAEQQSKDYLFRAVVHGLVPFVDRGA